MFYTKSKKLPFGAIEDKIVNISEIESMEVVHISYLRKAIPVSESDTWILLLTYKSGRQTRLKEGTHIECKATLVALRETWFKEGKP